MEPQSHFKIHEIPNQFMIDGKKYLLLCSILYLKRKKHFVAVFNLGGQNFLVDDLKPSVSIRIDSKDHQKYFKINISSSLYYLSH